MKKILGLDIGVSSIGWALIDENSEGQKKVIGLGSRIIPLSADDKDEFSTGNAISKNQKRTLRRTQRKGYDRYQLRRTYLKQRLEQMGMLPEESLLKLNPLELYGLRAKAVTEKVSLTELGRVLLHLNQKRGYKSSRSEENADKKETEYVATVKSRHQHIKELGLTVGQFFYDGLLQHKSYRVKEQVFPREAYQEEYDAIMRQQMLYYPGVLTSEIYNQIRNEIIYFQRPLKSQKGLVSVCEFEGFWQDVPVESGKIKQVFVGPKVAPRSSPLFQVCKLWETINTITLKNKRGEVYPITCAQKQALFDYLDNHERLTQAELFRILSLKRGDGWYGNKQLEKGLQGNLTKVKIAECLGSLKDKDQLLRFDIFDPIVDEDTGEVLSRSRVSVLFENEPLYKIWHIIYSPPEKQDVIQALMRKFALPEEVAERLSRLDFTKSGFGNKSAKAIRKILPGLQQGLTYSNACAEAGYNHSNSLTKEENNARQLLDKLPPISRNSLRQPVVEKILNQVVNLVNALLEKYGRPTEIRVELARELKQSKDERNSTYKNINKRERENDIIARRIEGEYGLRSTKRNIDKWRLFEEMSGKCIYCNKGIELADFLRGDASDVEHIIPRARLFDDSLQNKTIAHRKCNADKGSLTAYDFMQQKGKEEFENYIETIELLYKNSKVSKSKRDKLLMPSEKIPKDFIDRQLRETQYISRKAREILQQVCHQVYSTSGSVTDYLRHTWGWDEVLMNLQLERYRAVGLTEWREVEQNGRVQKKEFIKDWSKRDDHRHHAIDALTIACTTQGIIQRLNNLNQVVEAKYNGSRRDELLAEENLKNHVLSLRPFSTHEVEVAADQIFISVKAGKRVATLGKRIVYKGDKKEVAQRNIIIPRGPLSEESVYGKIKVMEKKAPIKLAFENPDIIVKERIRKLVVERIEKYQGDKKKALASLKKEPIYLDAEQKMVLEFATVLKEEIVIKYKLRLGRLDSLFKGNENEKQLKSIIESIIDEGVKYKIVRRLEVYNNKPKEAFNDLDNNPVYLDDDKKIKINSVRCRTGLTAVEPIETMDVTNGTKYTKYVKPGNNHHIAHYLDEQGRKVEHTVTFWHAVERKKYGLPALIVRPDEVWARIEASEASYPETFLASLPQHNWTFMLSLQQNEYFVLGMSEEEFNDALRKKGWPTISKNLYRVQNISSCEYWFRHHLETQINNSEESKSLKRFYRLKSIGAFAKLNPRKVHVSLLGDLLDIKYFERERISVQELVTESNRDN